MQILETDIVNLCRKFRSCGKRYMTEADSLAGARDLIRLTATATTLEWAAAELATLACVPLPGTDGDEIVSVIATNASPAIVEFSRRRDTSVRGQSSIDISHLYRAHIEPDPERTHCPDRWAFIEGYDDDYARRRLAAIVAAAELIRPHEAEERVSICQSARNLIKEGVSHDRELRLFEVLRLGDRVTSFVQQPLFIVPSPAALIRKWASIPHSDVTTQEDRQER